MRGSAPAREHAAVVVERDRQRRAAGPPTCGGHLAAPSWPRSRRPGERRRGEPVLAPQLRRLPDHVGVRAGEHGEPGQRRPPPAGRAPWSTRWLSTCMFHCTWPSPPGAVADVQQPPSGWSCDPGVEGVQRLAPGRAPRSGGPRSGRRRGPAGCSAARRCRGPCMRAPNVNASEWMKLTARPSRVDAHRRRGVPADPQAAARRRAGVRRRRCARGRRAIALGVERRAPRVGVGAAAPEPVVERAVARPGQPVHRLGAELVGAGQRRRRRSRPAAAPSSPATAAASGGPAPSPYGREIAACAGSVAPAAHSSPLNGARPRAAPRPPARRSSPV